MEEEKKEKRWVGIAPILPPTFSDSSWGKTLVPDIMPKGHNLFDLNLSMFRPKQEPQQSQQRSKGKHGQRRVIHQTIMMPYPVLTQAVYAPKKAGIPAVLPQTQRLEPAKAISEFAKSEWAHRYPTEGEKKKKEDEYHQAITARLLSAPGKFVGSQWDRRFSSPEEKEAYLRWKQQKQQGYRQSASGKFIKVLRTIPSKLHREKSTEKSIYTTKRREGPMTQEELSEIRAMQRKSERGFARGESSNERSSYEKTPMTKGDLAEIKKLQREAERKLEAEGK